MASERLRILDPTTRWLRFFHIHGQNVHGPRHVWIKPQVKRSNSWRGVDQSLVRARQCDHRHRRSTCSQTRVRCQYTHTQLQLHKRSKDAVRYRERKQYRYVYPSSMGLAVLLYHPSDLDHHLSRLNSVEN